MREFDYWYKNTSVRAYVAAVLLHILLFVFMGHIQDALLVTSTPLNPPVSEPVRFEFVDVADLPSSQPVETPLASHQNQVAQDQQERSLPPSTTPYSEGVVQNNEAFDSSAPTQEMVSQDAIEAFKEQVDQKQSEEGFDFAEVLKQDPSEVQKVQERAVFGRVGAPKEAVAYNNTTTGALERGGLQLSTYAWNYAPYMAYLKKQIDRHIFPPRAFDLGLIDGTTQLRFRIYRDGRLDGPELLGFKGSAMLKNTSLKAVELSAPFKGLPKDFPDDYLEITGTFEFIVLGRQQQK
jgi:outer membrane biosynthesis protein TonB